MCQCAQEEAGIVVDKPQHRDSEYFVKMMRDALWKTSSDVPGEGSHNDQWSILETRISPLCCKISRDQLPDGA